MARKRPRINGVIDKRSLAEIFSRADALVRQHEAAAVARGEPRPSGRLGQALIKELLTRAVLVKDRAPAADASSVTPAIAELERQAFGEEPKGKAKQGRKAPKAPKTPKAPKAPKEKKKKQEREPKKRILEPLRPQVRREKVLSLLEYLERRSQDEDAEATAPRPVTPTLAKKPAAKKPAAKKPAAKKPAAKKPAAKKPAAKKPAAKKPAAKKPAAKREPEPVEEVDTFAFAHNFVSEIPAMDVGSDPSGTNLFDVDLPELGETREVRSLEDTQEFLSLNDLMSSLSQAAKGHLDEQAAQRTMLEDLEMPVPLSEDPEAQKHLERVSNASEISFEGYLEDIEQLLIDTYEHYKSMPGAFESAPVDPTNADLLGPGGKTLESRRAKKRSEHFQTTRTQTGLNFPSRTGPRSPSARGPQHPSPPQRPVQQVQPGWPAQPVQPYSPPPQPTPKPAQPVQSYSPPPQPTPKPVGRDPFALDPFGGPSPTPPAQSGSPGRVDPFAVDPYTGQPVTTDPFAVDPFNPFSGHVVGAPPQQSPQQQPPQQQPPPQQPPPQQPPPQQKTPPHWQPTPQEAPRAEDPYAWPSQPPPAALDAQRQALEDPGRPLESAKIRADADARRFDPFAGTPGSSPSNPFGPGNMFGTQSQVPPTRPGGGRPIYVQDSEEILPADQPHLLDASETRRAFENALVAAGLRGMLEYQRPTPGHGSSHRVLLIYDAQRGVFKAPLSPRLSVGDRFQLQDGRVFRVDRSTIFEVGGTPCYQEALCSPLGRMNMPLRDSWDGK